MGDVELRESAASTGGVSHHREQCVMGTVEKLEVRVLQRLGTQDKLCTYFTEW